jgi:hypothetical protein
MMVPLIVGLFVIPDSAQYSAMVTEVATQAYVGTAITIQVAIGFLISALTIWLVPVVREEFGASFLGYSISEEVLLLSRLSKWLEYGIRIRVSYCGL